LALQTRRDLQDFTLHQVCKLARTDLEVGACAGEEVEISRPPVAKIEGPQRSPAGQEKSGQLGWNNPENPLLQRAQQTRE
jgi:hypothetical protein